jgi:mersacidin/lichenicidin family type 2 lantibiotic
MSATEIVRAWTDEEFRAQLDSDELAAVPDNPAGCVDAELDQLIGAPGVRAECPMTTFSKTPCCG